jgi:hypothetical protein
MHSRWPRQVRRCRGPPTFRFAPSLQISRCVAVNRRFGPAGDEVMTDKIISASVFQSTISPPDSVHERRPHGHVAGPSRRRVMVSTKDLLDHIEALLRLSHDAKDRAISAKIREMADELRILISVADVTDLAAGLSNVSPVAVRASNEMVAALYETKPKRRRREKERASDASSPKPKRRAKKQVEE